MSLLGLPNELLLEITSHLKPPRDFHSLICCNHRLNLLLAPTLRSYAITEEYVISALFCAVITGDRGMIKLILESENSHTVAQHTGDKENNTNIVYRPPKICTDEVIDSVVKLGNRIRLFKHQPPRALSGNESGPEFILYGAFPPLHWAILKSNYPMVQMLLNEDMDPNERTVISFNSDAYLGNYCYRGLYMQYSPAWKTSLAPLHIAAHVGNESVVRLLLEKGADIKASMLLGRRAIHIAAQMGHEGVVRLLLEKGVNVQEPNDEGLYPLFLAVMFEHEGVARVLLEKGADPDLPGSSHHNKAEKTLLHCFVTKNGSCKYNCWSLRTRGILRLLLESGANPTFPDRSGESVCDIAESNRDPALVRILGDYSWYEKWHLGSRPHPKRKRLDMRWETKRWCRRKKTLAVLYFVGVRRSLTSMLTKRNFGVTV